MRKGGEGREGKGGKRVYHVREQGDVGFLVDQELILLMPPIDHVGRLFLATQLWILLITIKIKFQLHHSILYKKLERKSKQRRQVKQG